MTLLRYRSDYYWNKFPTANDSLLVVEVADTSLQYDKEVKLPLYTRARIPEVWIFDLASQVILVYRKPSNEGYKETFTVRKPDNIAPLAFPSMVLTTDQLLG
jgi:Uma2 family endonuclease